MSAPRLPIVVVGAGVAGLATALAAAPAPVLLLCRDAQGGGSASALAQGGIAAALAPGDSVEAHARDTLVAGARHNDAAMAAWLCAQAPATVAWLSGLGVEFDRGDDGHLLLGREGGHHASRIVHAGGAATGAAVVRALQRRVREAPHIQWRGGLDATGLLMRGDDVCGVLARDGDRHLHEIEAAAVVLATGGIGALYARTSNPAGADGAGLALALAVGAPLRDLEFMQFHPTALDVPGRSLPLLTEALRGAGATLHDHTGRTLMAGVHPLGDLAPRDIVARRVWQAGRRGTVWLDARGIEGLVDRFPSVFAACRAHGFDPRVDRLPVTPAAHFHMGGIAVDTEGASGIGGLYAVGEVACNGVHGANRLASNSLLEGIACGRRLGARLAQGPRGAAQGSLRVRALGGTLPATPLARVRELLWNACGPLRDGAGLRAARAHCLALQGSGWQARVALALLEAALARGDSLGAHHRTDAHGMAPRMRLAVS
ncbi:MAG: L-aspartate oxidase [Lysobacteraceae bacterium]